MPGKITESDHQQLQRENAALREQVGDLQQQLDWFKRQLFGRKSEKLLLEIPANQAALFGAELAGGTAPPSSLETLTVQRRNKHRDPQTVNDTGLRFDASVPVQLIELRPPQLQGAQADQYEIIGHKSTFRLAQRPASYVVLEYRRPVIKHHEATAPITTPAPPNVLEKSIVDVSFLAGLIIDKFLYHLPLYRQHQRLANNGVELSRASLTHYITRALQLLRPIYEAQLAHVLLSRILAMDETPIKAGLQGKGKMRQAYFWPIFGQHNELIFAYAPSRAYEHVARLLGPHFDGTLLTDGYQAYRHYADVVRDGAVTLAQCWVHTRRYFEKALEAEPAAATEALQIIGALYKHERIIGQRGLEGEKKLAYRTKHSAPIVDQFFQWCDDTLRQRPDLSPSNPLSKAIGYATDADRVNALKVFLADPEVAPDTNHLERSLRPIPMGRRSWLFCWSEVGAELVGIAQSLISTCRLQGVNPYTYLVDVLQRVGQHPASDVIALTPRVWKERFADNPLRSDVDLPRARAP